MASICATFGSLAAASCSFGSSRTASFSVTGLAGFCGTSLASRSTWPSGISSTRPTLRITPRARNEPKVMICATRSAP